MFHAFAEKALREAREWEAADKKAAARFQREHASYLQRLRDHLLTKLWTHYGVRAPAGLTFGQIRIDDEEPGPRTPVVPRGGRGQPSGEGSAHGVTLRAA